MANFLKKYLIQGHSSEQLNANTFRLSDDQYVIYGTTCGNFARANYEKGIPYAMTNFIIRNIDRQRYTIKVPGSEIYDIEINFQGINTIHKGIFNVPYTHSNTVFYTQGTNKSTLRNWFGSIYKTKYKLSEIIGNRPGIFIVNACRAANGSLIGVGRNTIQFANHQHPTIVGSIPLPRTNSGRTNQTAAMNIVQIMGYNPNNLRKSMLIRHHNQHAMSVNPSELPPGSVMEISEYHQRPASSIARSRPRRTQSITSTRL